MRKAFLLINIILYTLCAQAQQLAGEWYMEPLTSNPHFDKEAVVLEDDDFHTKGIKFTNNGKFYSRNTEKGTFKQIGDTLILIRKKESILAYKKKCEEKILPKDQFEDKQEYNQQLLDLVKKVNLYATDTLLIYKNMSGTSIVLNSINSEFSDLPLQYVFYLHKKGTNESSNKNRSVVGKWTSDKPSLLQMDFRNDGKVVITEGNRSKTEKYKLKGEHLTIGNHTLRFVMGNANVAFLEMEQQKKNPVRLERAEKIEESPIIIDLNEVQTKGKKNGKRR